METGKMRFRKAKVNFVKVNLNPSKLKTSDCVVRAIAKTEEKHWLEIYWDLCTLGASMFEMPNGKNVWKKYLTQNSYTKTPVKEVYKLVNSKRKRKVVNDVCKLDGEHIVQVANHIVAVKDKQYYDTIDSGGYCVYTIWTKGVQQ